MKSGTDSFVACPLCSSQEHQTLATRGRAKEDLHTAICTGCGLVFSCPIPTEEEIAAYYATKYRLEYKGTARPKLKHIYRAGMRALKRLPIVEELVAPASRVLDIGSGGGEFVYLLQSCGYDVHGIEPDVGYGTHSMNEYGIDVTLEPYDSTRVVEDSFDLVTANHVVEHLRDPLNVFQGVHRALVKDGHFVVEVPNVESMYHTPSNKWHFAHVFNFNRDTLENLGRRAGFEIVRTDFVGSCQHVRTIFRKACRQIDMRVSNANYQRVKQSLDSYTDWDHFSSTMPVRRLVSLLSKIVHEKIVVDVSLSGKEILDQLFDKSLPVAPLQRAA